MLNARFAEIARTPDAPFLQASAGRGGLVRTTEATRLSAVVRENEVERGLAAMFEEAERVARFGFTATELDRQKRSIQRSIERAVADRHNHISADLAAEYSRNYLTTEPIPGIVYESRLYERFLPEITLAEVNALARDWSPDRNRVVMVSAPERLDVTVPTETALAAVMNGVASRTLTPYEDLVSDQPLLTSLPEPGRIVGTETRPALDITEWTLSNGVRVILKPTTFREDQILFQAFSPGGHSLVADEDFIAASTASQVIGAGGIGQLSELDLRKLLTGKVASVRPSIGPYHEGLSGSGSRQDLETLFQLIHLTFTQPRADAEIFQLMTDQTRVALENQTVLPEYAFNRVLNEALTQGHPRARMLTPESVEEMDLQRSLAIYRERFANASDFTFVFVGSFEPAMLQPFVERYLGSLPAFDRTEQGRDFDIRPAPGVLARRVAKGIEPKSQTSIVFSGPFEYDAEHRAVIRAMGMSLAGRLRNALREDLGGTYSVNASPSYTDIPKPRYTVNIAFGSDPGRTEALTARVFAEIDRLKQEGPGSSELDDIKETLRRDYEANMRQNGFLLSNLVGRYQSGERVDDLFDMAGTYDRITPADVQAAARAYLDTDNYVAVQLFPEQPEE
jgi:zinc protease